NWVFPPLPNDRGLRDKRNCWERGTISRSHMNWDGANRTYVVVERNLVFPHTDALAGLGRNGKYASWVKQPTSKRRNNWGGPFFRFRKRGLSLASRPSAVEMRHGREVIWLCSARVPMSKWLPGSDGPPQQCIKNGCCSA